MRSQKTSVILLAVSIGLALVFTSIGPFGMLASVQAASDIILFTFTDTSPIQYAELSGIVLGEGVHVGELRCVGDICNQKIVFEPVSQQSTTDPAVYEYKFKSIQAFDPVAERVVVSGTGTIIRSGLKTRFSFTGILQNNGDGTVRVTYAASTPDASFMFPAAPGTFSVLSNH